MLVRVIRVAAIPGGLSLVIDDQPDCLVVWVLEKDYSAAAANMLEAAMNVSVWHWTRRPAVLRANLRAV